MVTATADRPGRTAQAPAAARRQEPKVRSARPRHLGRPSAAWPPLPEALWAPARSNFKMTANPFQQTQGSWQASRLGTWLGGANIRGQPEPEGCTVCLAMPYHSSAVARSRARASYGPGYNQRLNTRPAALRERSSPKRSRISVHRAAPRLFGRRPKRTGGLRGRTSCWQPRRPDFSRRSATWQRGLRGRSWAISAAPPARPTPSEERASEERASAKRDLPLPRPRADIAAGELTIMRLKRWDRPSASTLRETPRRPSCRRGADGSTPPGWQTKP